MDIDVEQIQDIRFVRHGDPVLTLGLGDNGHGQIVLGNIFGSPRVVLGTTRTGEGMLTLKNNQERTTLKLGTERNGGGQIELNSRRGEGFPVAALGQPSNMCGGVLQLFNKSDNRLMMLAGPAFNYSGGIYVYPETSYYGNGYAMTAQDGYHSIPNPFKAVKSQNSSPISAKKR